MTIESKIIKILSKIKEDLDVNRDFQLIAKIFIVRSVGGCDFSGQRRRSA